MVRASDLCRHCGERESKHCRECSACPGEHSAYCSKEQAQYRTPRKRNPVVKNVRELFKNFHGTEPRERQVDVPQPRGPILKIGRLIEVVYQPEAPSQLRGKQFQHTLGDEGAPFGIRRKKLSDRPILATDGRDLFIIRGKSIHRFDESGRGIIA